jgi:hypothetical protein
VLAGSPDRIERARRGAARATIVPFLVRCGIALASCWR